MPEQKRLSQLDENKLLNKRAAHINSEEIIVGTNNLTCEKNPTSIYLPE